ncbi:MAG: TolC family protein [Saprospiraceae bacterium]|nr:TolC family protein [Saprospiraceae bacterium]HPG08984.1 TolC family protein [Saprospiraceae bacterium]
MRFNLTVILVGLFLFVQAQQPVRLTMQQVIDLAQSDAPDVLLAETRYSQAYWLFKSYRADLKPQLNLFGTLPNLTRAIESVVQPNGTEQFIQRANFSGNLGLTLQQAIPQTGGQVFAYTSLQRFDNLRTPNIDPYTQYLSNPISIQIQQPIFGYNDWKWRKLIEPLQLKEAEKSYSEDLEQIAYAAVQNYFDLLGSQLAVRAAEQEKAAADTLYLIGQGRFEVGKIAETELLQLELRVMNADAALNQAQLDIKTKTEVLRNFLGIQDAVDFDLVPPDAIPEFIINQDEALQYANANRSKIDEFERRLLQMESNVEEQTRAGGVNLNMNGRFGLTQNGPVIGDVYTELLDQEIFTLGITVPIADWGKRKSRVEIAKARQKLEQQNVAQERVNFERDIIIKVQQLTLLREGVKRAEKALEAANKRFDLTSKRYVIGKVDVTELNLANNDRENNRQSYVNAVQAFWTAYYEIRTLTLYDFIHSEPLLREVKEN